MVLREQADGALRHAVGTGEVPGVVALAGNREGPIYEGAFGQRELGGSAPMTTDTVFWIASMTKAITSVAAMQLVEQGRLALDEPLGSVLPALAEPQVLEGFDESERPRLRPARRPITLRHLLTHTAGFAYDIWSERMLRYNRQAGLPGIIECREASLHVPLLFDPGERWEYGINIDWAGKAVEAVSGQRLDAYLRTNVFEPLGMRDTGFVLGQDQRRRLASMHARGEDGSLSMIAFEVPQEPEFFMGGGGLYSTGPDYLCFLRALLNEGELDGTRILGRETVAEMNRNQIGELTVNPMRTVQPGASNDVDLFPEMIKRWGLGYLITTERTPSGRSAGSLAWAGLANTYYWLDPAAGLAGVILTQILPFGDAAVLKLAGAFEAAVYDQKQVA
jgi:CubicO group peptidase (beta-lactamase class C family)